MGEVVDCGLQSAGGGSCLELRDMGEHVFTGAYMCMFVCQACTLQAKARAGQLP